MFILVLALLLAGPPRAEGAPPRARLLTSFPEPYLGQAFILSMEIQRGSRSGAIHVRWPNMDNLAVEAHLPATVRRVGNGGEVVEYLHRLVRPLRSGSLLLAPGQGSLPLATLPELQVNVRPLPTKGRPEGFTGLVGQLDYRLEDPTGRGRRQIFLHLKGDADLSRATAPLSTRDGDTLTLLDDQQQQQGKISTRQLRFLYTPADNGAGELHVRLAWFDPQSGSYRRSYSADSNRHVWLALLLIPALLPGLAALRRRSKRRQRLHRWLGEKSLPGDRQQRLMQLAAAGGSEILLLELLHFWQQRDRRFSTQSDGRGLNPSPEMVRKLLKHFDKIDKQGTFRP